MGVMTRVRRLLRANIHDALDKAEDPAKMLNYLILEMQEGVEQAVSETATAMAAEKRLAQQTTEAVQAAAQWEMRARQAVERGEDDLAREALRRRMAALELAEQYQRAHGEQQQAVAELRQALERLHKRLQEAKVRRVSLLGQLQASQAHQVVARTMRQAVGQDAFEAFDRIAEQIAVSQNRAVAITELTRDDADDVFLVAEEHSAIEHKLASMKQEMGYLDAPPGPKALEEQGNPQ